MSCRCCSCQAREVYYQRKSGQALSSESKGVCLGEVYNGGKGIGSRGRSSSVKASFHVNNLEVANLIGHLPATLT